MRVIQDAGPGAKYYVLIVDAQGDGKVLSYIRDRGRRMEEEGYRKIIGLRDVYPEPRVQICKLQANFSDRTSTITVPTLLVLAVMEIEAWFIAEYKHFAKVDSTLTPRTISERIGFDPSTVDVETRDHPSNDMCHIYSLVGKQYDKKKDLRAPVIDNLDYEHVYLELRDRIPSLGRLLEAIDCFLDA